MTTIKDIAKTSGVSVGTVSKVLNGDKSVKDVNRRAVEEAVEFLELLSTPEMGEVMQNTKGEISTSVGVEVSEDSDLYEIVSYINEGKVFDYSGYDELFASDELQNIVTNCVTEFLMSEEKDIQECLENLDAAFSKALGN